MNQNLPDLNVVGVMTGNSLDAVDLVLSRFSDSGDIQDLITHSTPFSPELRSIISTLKECINASHGKIAVAIKEMNRDPYRSHVESILSTAISKDVFDEILDRYHAVVIESLLVMRERAKAQGLNIDLIGFHGQTCGHRPPSQISSKSSLIVLNPYTIQIGNPGEIADALSIPVVSDFRSDDIFNGGEGAPLAPVHHQHLAKRFRNSGIFPICFCNGGNTGNFTIISTNSESGEDSVMGWDTSPFNHITDSIARQELGMECDINGEIGCSGEINLDLLGLLFNYSASAPDGANFILQSPPKSSDPQWYRMIEEVCGTKPIRERLLTVADRLRTAQYFAAYAMYFNLSFVPPLLIMPRHFAMCGGGWRNKNISQPFEKMVRGEFDDCPILPEHRRIFEEIQRRITKDAIHLGSSVISDISVGPSEQYHLDGTAMEARIFADAAVCRIKGIPFSLPSTTGVKSPTICGAITYPKNNYAPNNVALWVDHYRSNEIGGFFPKNHDYRLGRASFGA